MRLIKALTNTKNEKEDITINPAILINSTHDLEK